MATFITSKSVGELLNLYVETTSGNWRYFHNGTYSSIYSNGSGDGADKPVENANGEFTIISCLSDGTESGDITNLSLESNQLTSFDGTGLSGLTVLILGDNQLTSFDGTGLSSLTHLYLNSNQLTSFDGTGLSSLTILSIFNNQLSGFTETELSGLTELYLSSNQLTSFDGTGLSGLTTLNLQNNPLTPQVNDSILDTLYLNGLENGQFYTSNGRTAASTSDYNTLISRNWGIQGADLPTPPSSGKLRIKGVGQY